MFSGRKRFVFSALSILLMTSLSGCKKQGGSTAGTPDSFPQKVGEAGDATATIKVGVLGKSGGKRLLIDLEKLPESGSANLWSCYQLPEDSFQFGRAVCKADNSKSVDITADNVDFTCEVNRDFGVVKAKVPLSLSECDSYDVYAYVFKPTLDLRIAE